MTLNKQISDMIRGSHVMSENPLTSYHATQDVKSAMRTKDTYIRCTRIKAALKNWRITVSPGTDGKVRVFRPDTRQEIFL